VKFRTGRKVGRTLYVQIGDQPDDMDLLIGIVDSGDQADIIVSAVNRVAALEAQLDRLRADYEAHERAYDMVDGDLYRILYGIEGDDA